MHQLNKALESETQELDTILLRLTVIRLLLAAGRPHMTSKGLEDLDVAVEAFDRAHAGVDAFLRENGHPTVEEAALGLDIDGRALAHRQLANLRTLHREVRVALSSTGTAAKRSLDNAIEHVPELRPTTPVSERHHRFMTGV